MIQLQHVYKTYQSERHVLRDVSLFLNEPNIHFITGLSGAGKTTLFRLLIGHEKPTSGEIEILGQKINTLRHSELHLFRQEIGVVFQDYKLIKDETVFDNLALPLKIRNWSQQKIKEEVQSMAENTGLAAYLDDYPLHLSGGEQQRIAIGRALIHKPKIIFADEPTGNLDSQTSHNTFELFQLAKKNGALILIVTHDLSLKNYIASKNFHLTHGELVPESP